MLVISQRYPRVAEYLEHQIGFDKWSQCHFLGMRYNITMTNMVEYLNNMLVNARDFPYITLLDVIQEKMSKWWNKKRAMGMTITSPLTLNQEDELGPYFTESNSLLTIQLNPIMFHVKRGGFLEVVVNIHNLTCTCCIFDIDRLPCVHAIVDASHACVGMYTLASRYYMKDYYILAYTETIYLVGSQLQWDVSEEFAGRVLSPHVVKERNRGRARMSRYPSAVEVRKCKTRYLKCGELEHYQKSCRSQFGSNKEIPPNEPQA